MIPGEPRERQCPRLRGTLLLALAAAAAPAGCGGGGGGPDAAEAGDGEDADGRDAPDTPDGDDDAGADAEDADDGAAPRHLRALLVDFDVLPADAWADLADALGAADVSLDYRRYYPHLTRADVEGEGAHDIVVLAAGLSPSWAAARMSSMEIEAAVALVQSGGLLVLVPWSGHLDAQASENEWFLFNRTLEMLDAPLRINKVLLIGDLFLGDPPRPHRDSANGYATSLEFDLGYAWVHPNAALPISEGVGDRIAAGRSTTLRTSGGDVEAWATALRGQATWVRQSGATVDEQIRRLTSDRAVAAVAAVGPGLVAAIPKGLLTAAGANNVVSHQPAMSQDVLASNDVFVRNVARRLAELRRGAPIEPSNPASDEELFAASAPGDPPITVSPEEISIASGPSRHLIADSPPAGDHLAAWPVPSGTVPSVPLFPGGKGTLGFGSVPSDPAQVDVRLAEAADMGIDTLMMTITPEQLVGDDLAPDEKDALRARIADVADRATAAGVAWTVGMYYSGYAFLRHDDEWPWSLDPLGRRVHQPAAAFAPYWDDVLGPAVVEVASIAATHPGIAGIEIDMETYDGALYYPDLQCLDDESYQVYLDGLADDTLRAELAAVSQRARLDELVDRGLLRDYLDALAAGIESAARRIETAVHAIDPDFAFVLYVPMFSGSWLYRALAAGFSTPDLPVVIISYDSSTNRQRTRWVGDGIPVVHLGGVILGNFEPPNLGVALAAAAVHTDGFWFFSFDEISDTAASDPRFGMRADYRREIAGAVP